MKLQLPLSKEARSRLSAGEEVQLSGIVYSARDQAHKRLCQIILQKGELPFTLKNQIIYYMGPAPTPENMIIGSCGPTTASRMDAFAPVLLSQGLGGMIAKGNYASEVHESIKAEGAVYFYAYGGCGALYAQHVKSCELVAFSELGPEAIYKLRVEDFPVLVAIDSRGNSIFSS